MSDSDFIELLWQKADELYRDMPWRDDHSFYNVLVSEIMLQQTQVSRALIKYDEFMKLFPTLQSLADSPLDAVLRAWQGLGYNRRAKYLHTAAQRLEGCSLPSTKFKLVDLPGVGENTAGAIMAYVYNQPEIYIETNIRTVYLYHYFADRVGVDDKEIREKLKVTLDHEHPREFYWALMDYGSWLRASGVRNTSASKHFVKQSPLKGSVREVRGQIVRSLAEGPLPLARLKQLLKADDRFAPALQGLERDGLIEVQASCIQLTS